MNMVKRLSMLMLLVTLAEPGCVPAEAQGTSVSSPEAHQLVSAGAVLLDVRTPEEFSGGHLDGARNIPVDEVSQRLAEIPRDKTVVVYCRSGARSARAAGVLRRAGYQARDLGPMSAW
jgi:phage shock protein E